MTECGEDISHLTEYAIRMKKLDQFILKSFIGPFVAILLVVVFILMMQFLWLYIDELVGKGLSFKVILEFLGWGAATLLPLSLPLATLLASMMTLGTLGENNELLAIKAAGISLQRILIPLCGACLVIAGLIAEGITEIHDIYHIDRGYDNLDGKLEAMGAKIWREVID